jgi:hypothetical protein
LFETWWFVGLVIVWAVVFGVWAGLVAGQRARHSSVWLLVGAIIGPVALVILHLAPLGRCPLCGNETTGWDRRCFWCGGDISGRASSASGRRRRQVSWGGRDRLIARTRTVAEALRLASRRIGGARAPEVGLGEEPTSSAGSESSERQIRRVGAPAAARAMTRPTGPRAAARPKPIVSTAAANKAAASKPDTRRIDVRRAAPRPSAPRPSDDRPSDARPAPLPTAAIDTGLHTPPDAPGAEAQGSQIVADRSVRPKVPRPRADRSKGAVPKAVQPKAAAPIVAALKAVQPKGAVPIASGPKAVQPKAAMPKAAMPAAGPKAALPSALQPNTAAPNAAAPSISESTGVGQEVSVRRSAVARRSAPAEPSADLTTGPTVTAGKPAQPAFADSGLPLDIGRKVPATRMTPRTAGQPEAGQPEADQPGADQPEAGRPRRVRPKSAAAKTAPQITGPAEAAPSEGGRTTRARPNLEAVRSARPAAVPRRDWTTPADWPPTTPLTAAPIASAPNAAAPTAAVELTPHPSASDTAESMTILTSGVFVGGSARLMLGERYLIARRGPLLQILGPIAETPSRVIVEEALETLTIVGANDRLVMTRTRGRDNLALAFQRLAGASPIEVEEALGPGAPWANSEPSASDRR